jgi:uncharacterized glyoxalase superfamily protein PhnB
MASRPSTPKCAAMPLHSTCDGPRRGHGRGTPAEEELLAAWLEVDDAKSLFLELRDGGAPNHQGLRTEPWGRVTFVVWDPDGNLISFGSPMP